MGTFKKREGGKEGQFQRVQLRIKRLKRIKFESVIQFSAPAVCAFKQVLNAFYNYDFAFIKEALTRISTVLLRDIAMLIGLQLVVFGALARRYQMVEGVLPQEPNCKRFLMGLSLETLLQAAVVILAAGLAGTAWAVAYWAHSGFGPIHYNGVIRVLVMSLTAIAAAIQLAAAGFLASVFTLRR